MAFDEGTGRVPVCYVFGHMSLVVTPIRWEIILPRVIILQASQLKPLFLEIIGLIEEVTNCNTFC